MPVCGLRYGQSCNHTLGDCCLRVNMPLPQYADCLSMVCGSGSGLAYRSLRMKTSSCGAMTSPSAFKYYCRSTTHGRNLRQPEKSNTDSTWCNNQGVVSTLINGANMPTDVIADMELIQQAGRVPQCVAPTKGFFVGFEGGALSCTMHKPRPRAALGARWDAVLLPPSRLSAYGCRTALCVCDVNADSTDLRDRYWGVHRQGAAQTSWSVSQMCGHENQLLGSYVALSQRSRSPER